MARRLMVVLALALALVMLGAQVEAVPAATPPSPVTHPWAGEWNDSFGRIGLRLMTPAEIAAAETEPTAGELIKKVSCDAGADYYRGGYNDSNDSGKFLGCSRGPSELIGRYVSDIDGHGGSFDIRLTSTRTWTGTYQDDGKQPGTWSGTFYTHFKGDGCCGPLGWKWSVTFENANNFWAGHGEGTSCRPEGRNCVANVPGYEGSIVDEECTISICSPCPNKPCKVTIPILPWIHAEVTNSTLQVLPLTVNRPYVAWRTPPTERILRLTIQVTSSSRTNLCPIGDVGEAILVDRDMVNSTTNVHASSFEVGGWTRPCLDQSFDLNGLSAAAHSPTGPALIPGQYATVVEIACYDPDTDSWNPAVCGG